MGETNINTKHKDRLFSFIFGKEKNKKWTLELYNAVNHSDYSNPDDMPDDFSIKAYLMEHRSEVNIMCLTEYDEAETMNMFKEEGRREGLELGLKEGEAERRRLEAEIEKLKKENEELRAMQNS